MARGRILGKGWSPMGTKVERMSAVRFTSLSLTASAVALLAATSICQANDRPDWVKSYSVTGRPTVHVHTNDGALRVMTSDSNEVEFRVRTEGTAWGIGFGSEPTITSRQDGNSVELSAQFKQLNIGFSNLHNIIEVRMPKNADLQLDTGDGSVELSSLSGNVQIHTSDGSVKIGQLAGTIDVSTSDGSIEGEGLKGAVKVHSHDGSVRVAEIDGKCDASSNDGSVKVEGRLDALDIHTDNGSVKARAIPGSSISSAWRVSSSDGSVEIALPTDLKANLDVSTSDGHIKLGLPVQVQGEMSKSHVRGTLNGGGPPVEVHSSDGSITISGS